MGALIEILRLFIPFVKEFGINKDDVLLSIRKNRYSWVVVICTIIIFLCCMYAVDQANTRMNEQIVLNDKIEDMENTITFLEYKLAETTGNKNHISIKGQTPNGNTFDDILNDLNGETDADITETTGELSE